MQWRSARGPLFLLALLIGHSPLTPLARAGGSAKSPHPGKEEKEEKEGADGDEDGKRGPLAPGDAANNPIAGGEGSAKSAAPEKEEPLKGKLELAARGVLVINSAYGRRPLVPGAYGLYLARPVFDLHQFALSGGNTVLGFKLSGLSYRGWKLSGSLDFSLKGATPASRVVLAPQFYDLHIGLVSSRGYILIGQFPDVIMPFVPKTTNAYPGSYLPGVIGFYRPQLRAGIRLVPTELFDVRVQGSIGRDVQTFDVSPLTIGGGAGIPDLQGRLSVAAGPKREEEERPWKRAYELGVSGHFGRRGFAQGDPSDPSFILVKRRTWSLGADVRAELPTGTTLRGRAWTGSVLSDYRAGVFQSVSDTLGAIAAKGLWFDIQQAVTDRTTLAAGYGIDDPDDDDVTDGERTRNQDGFANVFWRWSKQVTFAGEVSYWRTDWKALGATKSWRGEVLTAFSF